jgi:hypothetical protein
VLLYNARDIYYIHINLPLEIPYLIKAASKSVGFFIYLLESHSLLVLK